MSNTNHLSIFSKQQRPFLLVLVLAIIINLAGINTGFFTNDPGLYGLLAKTMVQTHNYTDLMYRGHDWLDKPHFPFWMVAFSFKIFGINTIAYKLPALLFFMMAVVYTYKLAKLFYNTQTALIAALILLTAQHAIMSNTDVRAEPYIMGLLMGSVYHFYRLKQQFSLQHLLIASLFAACAVMTKGIYLLIPIGFSIIGDYIFKKDFSGLLQWRWLLAVVLVALFTLPEIYTLYIQFDSHPEKVVFNHTGVSGIHWFLWDSQFGRFNNTGYISRPNHDYFFFLHTLLWAFAPWALLFYTSLFLSIKKIVKGIPLPEYVTLAGGLVMLLIFSISQFQLPFYTNILFPFFAIITAVYVQQVFNAARFSYYKIIQYTIGGALMVLITGVAIIFAPGQIFILAVFLLMLVLLVLYLFKNSTKPVAIFLSAASVIIWANAYIVTVVYPGLLNYKGDVQAARYINTYVKPIEQVVATFEVPDPFEFYLNRPVTFVNLDTVMANKNKQQVVLVEDTLFNHLVKIHASFQLLQAFNNYPNEVLTLPFLNQRQRYSTLNHFFLIKLD